MLLGMLEIVDSQGMLAAAEVAVVEAGMIGIAAASTLLVAAAAAVVAAQGHGAAEERWSKARSSW